MRNWKQFFSSTENSGIYSIGKDAFPNVRKAAAKFGLVVFDLDLKDISGKADFLNATAKVLHFPSYFGSNWDALNDCLTDLSWLDAEGYVLLFQNLENFRHNAPEELAVARSILQDAAAYWKQRGVCFFVGIAGENPESDFEILAD